MGTYTNWKHDLLSSDRMPDTTANLRFMGEFHTNSESDCALNPIDLTHHVTGESSNCKQTGYVGRYYQRYTDRIWTRTAFYAQMTSGDYPHLRAALRSGNPYTVSDYLDVSKDIGKWSSGPFSSVYLGEMQSGGPIPTLKAPQALAGWKDVQHSVNRGMPAALKASEHMRNAAWRHVRRAGKLLH